MKKFFLIIKIMIFVVISAIVINLGMYIFAYITPKTPLKTANQISFYDNKNELVFSNLDGTKWVELKEISKHIINSTIATEDKNFYSHKGFDYIRIASAFFSNFKSGNINQGASTISQQYIKNLYLDFDKNWGRKIEEAYLTFELETHYSKDEILEGYLNTINYGAGNYGIENASQYYFGKSAKELNIEEATLIAGIPKNPTKYNPVTNYKSAKERQKVVLISLANNRYIKQSDIKKILEKKVHLNINEEKADETNINYYKDAVLNELKSIKEIPESLIKTGGLKIYTNLDVESQKILNDTVKEEMNNEEKLQVASLVAEPNSGKIIALVGGKDYKTSEYNRVTQAKRQVGSTIKPFLYYTALENGLTASSTFSSEKTTFTIGKNKIYSPSNYRNKYPNKEITMAAAIAYSDNIYAVKTHLFLGEDELINTLKSVGIDEGIDYNPSLALGTSEISMIDYADGYITLANYGIKNEGYLINKITDYDGKVLYKHKNNEEKVLSRNSTFIINELLSNTYSYDFVDYSSPTMLSVKSRLTKKYAIKSGSTDNDYWTVGYNPNLLVMVWNGNDDNSALNSSQSKISKNIWAKTIENILKNKESSWYPIAENITAKEVNPISGKLEKNKKVTTLYYEKGTEPYYEDKILDEYILNNKKNNNTDD